MFAQSYSTLQCLFFAKRTMEKRLREIAASPDQDHPPPSAAMVSKELGAVIVSKMAAANKSGAEVSAWGSILEELTKDNLTWFAEVRPSLVIVDYRNRSGLMLDPAVAHSLGSKIRHQGWSSDKAKARALAAGHRCARVPVPT